jgi:hypothetical protein
VCVHYIAYHYGTRENIIKKMICITPPIIEFSYQREISIGSAPSALVTSCNNYLIGRAKEIEKFARPPSYQMLIDRGGVWTSVGWLLIFWG